MERNQNVVTRPLFALAAAAAVLLAATPGWAVVTDLALYKLGEAGTVSGPNLLPQDLVGSHHFTQVAASGAGNSIIPSDRYNSTAAMNFNGDGFYNAGSDFVPDDNFVVEMWARTSNASQGNNTFFTTAGGPSNNTLKFHVHDGNWAASLHNASWIGGAGGAGQPITEDVWTHLAVSRSAGVSKFYIDGIEQGPSANQTPETTAGLHLGVSPGGQSRFFGDLDEVRIFTFDPETDDPVANLSINLANAVPEPTSAVMLVLAGAALLRRRHA